MTHLLVPLYVWIGDQTEIDQAVDSLRRGDIAIVTGPQSGPPNASESLQLREIVNRFHQNGVTVVGYVPWAYARRPLPLVLEEMSAWRILCGVDGVFIDEATADAELGELRAIHGLARSWRHAFTATQQGISVWNTGTWTERIIELQRRLPTSIWNVWEGPAARYVQDRPRTHLYPQQEAHIVYQAAQVSVSTPPTLGYKYITADDLPNPFDTFDELHLR
jgi:hypothetical protein